MADDKPYGDVEYADPGYQDDGKKRYPLDTEAHCRAAWSYINQAKNAAKYSPDQLTKIKQRIKKAGKEHGIDFAEAKNAATPLLTGRSWYRINNLATGEVELMLYDDIGGWGITAQQMIHDLDSTHGRDIVLRMNTQGGDVFEGIAIYSALRQRKGRVVCKVDSLAASIGSVIAMAADHVVMARPAKMMIHDAQGTITGSAAEVIKFHELLDSTSDTIAGIYADHTGGSAADWRARMREETWFTADEAVDAGLADEIETHDARAVAHASAKVEDVDQAAAVLPWDPAVFRAAMKEAAQS